MGRRETCWAPLFSPSSPSPRKMCQNILTPSLCPESPFENQGLSAQPPGPQTPRLPVFSRALLTSGGRV